MKKKELTEEQLQAFAAALHDFSKFRMALINESDRGCALFSAAYLDKALGDLLKASIVKNPRADDDLFSGQNPLSSFSSRIKMAYYLGKIAIAERKDLDTIRNIRNDFAHNADHLTFSDLSIAARCNNLTNSWREANATPRQKFTAAVSGLMVHVSHATRTAEAIGELPSNPIPQEIFEAARNNRSKIMDEIKRRREE